MDSPASPDPQTPADDDTDDEYVDYCPYPETPSVTDSLPVDYCPCPETQSATDSSPELSALPKASGSMTGTRSPTPPTATWSWSSSSGDGDGDDKDYRGMVDDCSEAVIHHVRRAVNTCCTTHVANEVRACFGVLMREAMEPASLDDIVNQILQ